jgi:ornithine carbamoyltransferase
MARTLGRMYDAIDCGTLPAVTVREIEAAAGVPVYQGLGLDSHPLRILGDLMTLYEHALPPSTPPTIRFHGDTASPQARTFVSAARNIGFEVAAVDATPDAANDAAFVVDASGQARWPIRTRTGSIDEDRRAENHRNVIQAVLLDTLASA